MTGLGGVLAGRRALQCCQRLSGETKYPFKKMFKLALNAITGFSYFPLQLATYIGFIAATLAILVIPVVAVMREWLVLSASPLARLPR